MRSIPGGRSPGARGRAGPWLLAFVVLLPAALALAAAPAGAHAVPTRTEPGSGAVVQLPPREVVMVFSERLDPVFSRLEVLDANRTVVSERSSIDGDGLTVRAALPRDLPYGGYTLSWRALSSVDGHSTRGLSSFLFPDPSKPLDVSQLPPSEAEAEAIVGPQDALLRGLGFLGLIAAVGLPVLLLGVLGSDALPRPWDAERRLGQLALAAAALGAVATVLLTASAAGAASQVGMLAALSDPQLLAGNRYGAFSLARAGLLAAAGAVAWLAAREGVASPRGHTAWAAAALLGIAAMGTVSLTSHAAALQANAAPLVLADVVHLAAGAAWVGGLAGLGWVLWQDRERSQPLPWAALAGRFSALATASVALVVLTGVTASLVHLRGSLALLTGSLYGQVLLAKVAFVAVLLAIGARNRFQLLPALRRDPSLGSAAWPRFGRSVRAEAAVGVVVLLLAGGLTALSPPAAPIEAGPPPVFQTSQEVEGVNLTLLVTPSPVRVGLGTFDVFLTETGVAVGNATNATFTFLPPDRTLGSSQAKGEQVHPGHFAVEGGYLTMPGAWKVRVLVQRTGGYDLLADFPLEVAA